jgi:hypothetical protein
MDFWLLNNQFNQLAAIVLALEENENPAVFTPRSNIFHFDSEPISNFRKFFR